MKTLILTAAAVALSFSLTSEAEAKGPVSGGHSMSSHGTRSFSFHGHHAYRVGHNFWNQRRWFSNYGCYGYYCPIRSCWYYQYQGGNCYLPFSCMQQYAPTTVVPNAAPVANLPPVTPNLPPAPPVKPVKPVKPV